ncbi:hypothetical protein [Campylobacter sp. W0066.1]|uniref:hypothetical protein n=1 Tax=Campylobacter sp. W0066.1 TaxID=2735751 RepID=UPI00301BF4ED|nr:hypothetical protein [Campylobacter sp. W0066.1]
MTVYLHIGTMKTGSTSIQTFFNKNYLLLIKKNVLFPIKCTFAGHHYFLVYQSGEFCQEQGAKKFFMHTGKYRLISKDEIYEYVRKCNLNYKAELLSSKCSNVVFSDECISKDLLDKKEIINLKKILNDAGFTKIIILVYLREQTDFISSWYSQDIKHGATENYYFNNFNTEHIIFKMSNYKYLLENYTEVFGKENIIVKIFDKNEFYKGDLLKDFIYNIGLEWDDDFIIPEKENESLDLLGMELLKALNRIIPRFLNDYTLDPSRIEIQSLIQDLFKNNTDEGLKFRPSKATLRLYEKLFEESNEWVRKEFFPCKERLFPKKDLSNYKENYELKEMKPEYWDKIAEFITDIVKTKNQNIADKTNIIQNKDKIIVEQTTQIKSLQTIIKNNELRLKNTTEEKDRIINFRTAQFYQVKSQIAFQIKYGTAKQRIQNQLSYKLGQAMVVNSKSILGYIRMPFVLSYIKDKHKQEQKIYQEKIKKDSSLILPPLESYPDYKEALKEKECLTYKLGEALIQANKTWYKGGYIGLLFKIKRLKKDFKKGAR